MSREETKEIDGRIWRDGDIARDSKDDIYQLHSWYGIDGETHWRWLRFGTEYDYPVEPEPHPSHEAPVPPMRKMILLPAAD